MQLATHLNLIEIASDAEGFEAKLVEGHWHHAVSLVPLPGARDMTVAEFIGTSARRISKMGQWVDVPRGIAHAHPAVLRWCRKYAASELGSGAFRFQPEAYAALSNEALSVAYIPEQHDPNREIRALAKTERLLRTARAEVSHLQSQRVLDLRVASVAGHSRRQLGDLVGLSFARIQQIVSGIQARQPLR